MALLGRTQDVRVRLPMGSHGGEGAMATLVTDLVTLGAQALSANVDETPSQGRIVAEPRLAVSTTDIDALPERQPTSRSSLCQRTSRRTTLGGAHRPQRLSKDSASLAGLPSHPPIAGRSAEMASGQDDLIDRHRKCVLRPDTMEGADGIFAEHTWALTRDECETLRFVTKSRHGRRHALAR